MFTDELGGRLSGVAVTRQFQKKLGALGLPPQRWHDMRHASASYLVAQGVDLRIIMDILGHANIQTTANTYAHVLRDVQRQATAKVGELLFATS